MSYLGWIGVTNGVTSLSLGIFVLSRNTSARLNRIYFITNLAVAIYSFGYGQWQFSSNPVSAFFWFHVLFDGTILINLMYLFFAFALTGELDKYRRFLMAYTAITAGIIVIHHAGFFYDHLEPRFGMGLWPVPKFGLNLFVIYWHVVCFGGCVYLWSKARKTSGIVRQQIILVMVACGIGYLGGATNWFMWYSVPVTPLPTISISFYVALIAYAIVRHRLMEFGLLMRWGLAYFALALSLSATAAVLILAGESISSRYLHLTAGLGSIFGLCCLVLAFDPAKERIQGTIDRFVFRSPDFRIPLEEIEKVVTNALTLSQLAVSLAEQLKRIWDADGAGFALWNFSSSKFVLVPEKSFFGKPIEHLHIEINRNDFLVKTLESERRLFRQGVIVEAEVTKLGNKSMPGERTTFWKIRRTMRWLGADICTPLMSNEGLIGFMVLGPKRNKAAFNDEDKKFLAHVGSLVEKKFNEFIVGANDQMGRATITA